MKSKIDKITAAINTDKEISARLKREQYTSAEELAEHFLRYVRAVRDGRAIVSIESVSKSGMSLVMGFYEMAPTEKRSDGRKFCLLNFRQMFRLLGYTFPPNREGFRVDGCGMDMIFSVNHNTMRTLKRLGVISAKECAELAQMTIPRI
jgi:hypothetical protein